MKTKKMTLIIIGSIVLGLGMWIACFDTPKWLIIEILYSTKENSRHSGRKSERQKMNKRTAKINIEWVENLNGDFSFKDRWQYIETTVFKIFEKEGYDLKELRKTMQGSDCALVAKTFTDEEVEALCKKWEAQEKELEDTYYSHTRHYPYTLQTGGECEQLDFMLAEQISPDVVECQSSGKTMFAGEKEASLNLNIVKNECYPVIGFTEYNIHQFLTTSTHSVVASPFTRVYPCVGGDITIDKTCWDRGWLKASFSFVFDTPHSKNFTLSGRIFTPIRFKNLKGEPLIEFNEKQYIYSLSLISKYR